MVVVDIQLVLTVEAKNMAGWLRHCSSMRCAAVCQRMCASETGACVALRRGMRVHSGPECRIAAIAWSACVIPS